ncbi:MAG: hypothetical protein EOP79_15635 [Variovorax sp.]|nr:MAG: hypothetical protein EOP79_15635 [Variovorax sp.]
MNGLMMDQPLLISTVLTHSRNATTATRKSAFMPGFLHHHQQRSLDTRDDLLAFYDGKIAKWWRPDDVIFVDSIPLSATGQIQKNILRDAFQDHLLVTA